MSTFTQIYSEVYEHGFHYLNDGSTQTARVKRWVNEAYHEICEEEDWPFLETTASGSSPLALTRARNVESVVDTTDGLELDYAPRRWLLDVFGAIPSTGVPRYWYPEWTATDTLTINTAPSTSKTLSVRFFAQPADLSSDSDVAVLPLRWHWLILNGSLRRAYQDSDQTAEAEAIEADRQRGLAVMKKQLLFQGQASPNKLEITANDPVAPTGQQVTRGGKP